MLPPCCLPGHPNGGGSVWSKSVSNWCGSGGKVYTKRRPNRSRLFLLWTQAWMAACQPSRQNLWGTLFTSLCTCAPNNNCGMRQRKPHKRRALCLLPCLHAERCPAMHASEHKERTEAPRAHKHTRPCVCVCAPLCGTRGHHYSESTQRKSTKYSETFPTQEAAEGRSQVKSVEWKKKNKKSLSDSENREEKKNIMHQHAAHRHHPPEGQLTSFSSNWFFFFVFFSVTLHTQEAEGTQSSDEKKKKIAADVTAQLKSVGGQDVRRKRSRPIAFAPVVLLWEMHVSQHLGLHAPIYVSIYISSLCLPVFCFASRFGCCQRALQASRSERMTCATWRRAAGMCTECSEK